VIRDRLERLVDWLQQPRVALAGLAGLAAHALAGFVVGVVVGIVLLVVSDLPRLLRRLRQRLTKWWLLR